MSLRYYMLNIYMFGHMLDFYIIVIILVCFYFIYYIFIILVYDKKKKMLSFNLKKLPIKNKVVTSKIT